MGRKPCCDKTLGLKKGPWSAEEDAKLISYIMKNGHLNWRVLPKQAGLLRCGKSCRLRWTNYLRPDVKRGNFSDQEEDTIIKLQSLFGNKWSKIASYLPGRTDNEIKNIWNSYLKKRALALTTGYSNANENEQNGFSVSSSSKSTVDSPMSYRNPFFGPDQNFNELHNSTENIQEVPLEDQIAPADLLVENGESSCGSSGKINNNIGLKELYSSPCSYSTAGGSYGSKKVYGSGAQEQADDKLQIQPDFERFCGVHEEDNKEKDPTKEMLLDITFEPDRDIFDMLESTDESRFFTSSKTLASPLCDFEAHQNNDFEKDSDQGRSWLTYIENELGLQETKSTTTEEANNQSIIPTKDNAVESPRVTDNEEFDPVSIYFQMWPPSPHKFSL